MKKDKKLNGIVELDFGDKLKILPLDNSISADPTTSPHTQKNIPDGYVINQDLRLRTIQQPNELDGFVYLHTTLYKKIFTKPKYKSSDKRKRMSIVKITADNGQKIYREYYGISIKDFTQDHFAITQNTLYLLSSTNKDGAVVEPKKLILSNGSRFPLYSLPFYWHHPEKAIRVSYILGTISVFLGIVSLLLGCLSLYLSLKLGK